MHDVEGQTIDDVRAERDALGIQLAAQGERLRLAMAVVDAARALDVLDPLVALSEEKMDLFADALAALDAVPGDALAKVGTMNGVPVYVDPTLPEHVPVIGLPHPTRHLEASGIDTDRVKGGE
jgi:hypothetical protein